MKLLNVPLAILPVAVGYRMFCQPYEFIPWSLFGGESISHTHNAPPDVMWRHFGKLSGEQAAKQA